MIILSPIGMGAFTRGPDVLPELLQLVLGGWTDGAAAGSWIFLFR